MTAASVLKWSNLLYVDLLVAQIVVHVKVVLGLNVLAADLKV
jgi:hypothetical protein